MSITCEGGTEQVRQIIHHHAVLRRALERRAGTVCDAVASSVPCQRQVAIAGSGADLAAPARSDDFRRRYTAELAAPVRGKPSPGSAPWQQASR